ncbi:MAG: GNAT family N-acetyltransferase [Thermoplasmata archaeon]
MPKIRIRVRDAERTDLKAVCGLWEDLADYHATLSDHFTLSWDGKRRWSEYLEEKFSELSTKLIVAEEDGRIVGFMLCLLSPNVPIYKEKKIGVISDVYVREERRRKGVAKKMFDVAVNWFRKNKVRSVRLSVAADNLEARAAWRRLGFEPFMIDKRLDLRDYPKVLRARERAGPTRIVRRKTK